MAQNFPFWNCLEAGLPSKLKNLVRMTVFSVVVKGAGGSATY